MPKYAKPALVNGREVRAILLTDDDVCEFCGQSRCRWQDHQEARDDVASWAREEAAMWEPFGRHVEWD